MYLLFLFVVLTAGLSEKIVTVGLLTSGEVNGMIALAPEAIWTGEDNFSFRNKLAFDNIYQTDEEILNLFMKNPAYTKIVEVKKAYFFSGPQRLSKPVKCPRSKKCVVTATWNADMWKVTKYLVSSKHYAAYRTKPRLKRGYSFSFGVIGPALIHVVFNSISLKLNATFQSISHSGRYDSLVTEHSIKAIPSFLSKAFPNGIIGFCNSLSDQLKST
ncbi:hypothetical protein DSO57_1013125 [Entomophthora muscae]|uniref:Uncharacterized protein n=1 Tax=Entomophthora muscae TaxID=34485 RepID=A0ACC2SV65_9FUNG|nr:hypothetical protein DSO57_1013125 [Entomophthora muscae]